MLLMKEQGARAERCSPLTAPLTSTAQELSLSQRPQFHQKPPCKLCTVKKRSWRECEWRARPRQFNPHAGRKNVLYMKNACNVPCSWARCNVLNASNVFLQLKFAQGIVQRTWPPVFVAKDAHQGWSYYTP